MRDDHRRPRRDGARLVEGRKNGWNIMDTLILVFSWIDFATYFLGLDNAGKLMRKINI
jgi:hypothetical protein